jgi:hypothetical protein
MDVVKFLYHPDIVLAVANLQTIALDLIVELPIPEVAVYDF